MTVLRTALACVLLSSLGMLARDSDPPGRRPDLVDTDSLSRGFRKAVASLSSPELERRKAERRRLQKRGYCTVVQACGESDALSAVLALLRTHAQLAIHLPHTPLAVHVPIQHTPSWTDSLTPFVTYGGGYYSFTLTEDWSFPDDPWASP